MYRYVFEGQVSESNHLITNRWRGETWANSEAKARNNLAYQFKKANNRIANSRITLPGKINIKGEN